MPQTGHALVGGLAGDSISRCSMLTCNSKSDANLKFFTHKGQEKTSSFVFETEGEVRSKCLLKKQINTVITVLYLFIYLLTCS